MLNHSTRSCPTLLISALVVLQLKGNQEPKAKKSRRSQMVEPKEEASVSPTFRVSRLYSSWKELQASTLLPLDRTRSPRWRR